jgi:hypothetical protein
MAKDPDRSGRRLGGGRRRYATGGSGACDPRREIPRKSIRMGASYELAFGDLPSFFSIDFSSTMRTTEQPLFTGA